MVKIILCMIVKNESKIIERCVRSALPIIDAISICDTGSTDNTIEILENILKDGIDGEKISGKVYQHTWKNFGHNRSLSYHAALDTANNLGYDLNDTYALLLDADMKLVIESKFEKNDLNANSYLMIQKTPALSYHNTRFIRLDKSWKCVGVTHEYWAMEGATAMGNKIEHIFIDDVNDGGAKADKFERDIKLLTQGLIDEPENARYMFYLANSYHDVGNFDMAIEWYTNRIKAGGWPEEVFYSIYKIGFCHRNKGDIEKALSWFLKSFEFRPQRIEGLFEAIHIYRNLQHYNTAYTLCKRAIQAGWPKDDVLFIRRDVYEFLLDFEMSIIAYYVQPFGEYDHKTLYKEGYGYCLKLLSRKDLSQNIINLTKTNINFYREKLGIHGPTG
jgi:glycosyltransferase involved in cell wall biosynthesis